MSLNFSLTKEALFRITVDSSHAPRARNDDAARAEFKIPHCVRNDGGERRMAEDSSLRSE